MVVETGRPAVYEDPGAVPDLISPETVERFGLKTAVYVPLVAWGETLGVAVLDDRTPRRVTQQQVKLAQGVAAHGAVAPVPGVGFEPTCPCGRGILSPLRLTSFATRATLQVTRQQPPGGETWRRRPEK